MNWNGQWYQKESIGTTILISIQRKVSTFKTKKMAEITAQQRDWMLSLDTEQKIMLLDSMLAENEFGHWMSFSKVLLDAPISKGGLSTETIDSVFRKHFPNSTESPVNE
tara:strand:+ start:133 stop:459 length:327 start_codon:yes stop_codon:yes gene_type:complete